MRGIFVTATDTGVGKTIVTAGIAKALKSIGYDVGVFKPIATGCRKTKKGLVSEDAIFLSKAIQSQDPLTLINPISLEPPLSPNVAGRISGKQISISKILDAYNRLSRNHEVMLIEGIGGLMVPIVSDKGNTFFVADLVKKLKVPIIIVTRPTLGTLNHTLLTLKTAKRYGIAVKGAVINHYSKFKLDLALRTNRKAMQEFIRILEEIPYLGRITASTLPEKKFLRLARGIVSCC